MKEKLRFKLSGDMLIGRVTKETSSIREDKISVIGIIASLLLILFSLAIIILNNKLIPPEVPLFYNRPWGEQLVSSFWLWIALSINFIILVANSYIATILHQKEKLLSQMLIWTSVLFSSLLAITLFKIITMVI